jgi:hypothetical protein
MIHNSRNRIAIVLGAALAGMAGAGAAALQAITAVPDLGSIMSMPHSANAWRRNGGNGRGAVARSKRAARKRRNIRARAAK